MSYLTSGTYWPQRVNNPIDIEPHLPRRQPGLGPSDAVSTLGVFWGCVATAVLLASALVSQELTFSNLSFSLFWPPAGIAFALVCRYGWRALPSIALGIALPTFYFYPRWGSALIVLGETLGPFAGASLLRRAERKKPLSSVPLRWQLSFYLWGIAVTCPIAALLGSFGGLALHRFESASLPGVFLAYLMVEAIGLLLFGPFALRWLMRERHGTDSVPTDAPQRRLIFLSPLGIETARWLLFAVAGGTYADLLIYLYFPLVAWCALTSSAQKTNLLLMLVAVAVLTSQAWRVHGLTDPNASFDLFRFALVIFTLTVMGQLLSALASERQLAFAAVARQLDLDPLTGLLNERSFANALESLTAPTTIVLMAFDNWSAFEVLAGAGAGHDLQRGVGKIMASTHALTKPARLEPGTFACLVEHGDDSSGAIGALLGRRWSSRNVEMRLQGAALTVPGNARAQAGDLILAARMILNEARFSSADALLQREWSEQLLVERRSYESLADTVKQSVRAGRIRLYAQPIVWTRSDVLPHLEILVRIEGAHGDILPSTDVARVLAQDSISAEVDRAVIEATFHWFEGHRGALESVDRIAINLSGESLSTPGLFEWIESRRMACGLSTAHFAFEITEGQAILNHGSALGLVESSRKAGYRVALDDFGTGLATFDYLKRFPVDYIKIDGSFIRNLATSAVDREIVSSLVRLAKLMDIETVAEYVCDLDVRTCAIEAGVDALQGFAIHEPMPLTDAIAWCASETGRADTHLNRKITTAR